MNIPSDFLSRPPVEDRGKNDNQAVTMLPPKRIRTTNLVTVPPILEVRRGLMNLYHDHPLAGHPGRDETLRQLRERYHWPGMKEWVTNYIKGCATCQQNKILTHQKKVPMYRIGTLPNARPFESIAMDLITGLPMQKGIDAILTIVDQGCSRAAIFLPCAKTITGPQIAQLYLDNVYRWFGLPTRMILDRDPRFMSHFRRALTTKLGIRQNLSTAFHPQTDGLSERKNQWIEQYLRLVTAQHPEDWTKWLSIASVVHNNRRNATTGLSPNQILLSYEPILSPDRPHITANQTAEDRIKQMIQKRKEAIDALNWVAHNPEPLRSPYRVSDHVWLEATHLRLPYQTTKLNPKRYGPFTITEVLSPVVFHLQLLAMWQIHNVFHASLLSPYRETAVHGPNFVPPPSDLVDGEEEQEVERILNHWLFGKSRILQYLIKWKGFPDCDNEWVSEPSVHAPDLVKAFHRWRGEGIKAATVYRRSYIPQLPCLPSTSQTNPLRPLTSRPQKDLEPFPNLQANAPPPAIIPHVVPSSDSQSPAPLPLCGTLPTAPLSDCRTRVCPSLCSVCYKQPHVSKQQTKSPLHLRHSWILPLTNDAMKCSNKSSPRSPKSSIALLSPYPPDLPTTSWRPITTPSLRTESISLLREDLSQRCLHVRSSIRIARSISKRKYTLSRSAWSDMKRQEKSQRVTNEITETIPLSSFLMPTGYSAPPTGSNSWRTAKWPCWTSKGITPIPTSLTSTPPRNTTPTIPLPQCPSGSDNSWSVRAPCLNNSAMQLPNLTTGESSPTSYASENRMTTSGTSTQKSNNTRQSWMDSNWHGASPKGDLKPLKSTFNWDISKQSIQDIPSLALEELGRRKLCLTFTMREDSHPKRGGNVTGTRSWSRDKTWEPDQQLAESDQESDPMFGKVPEPGFELS